MKYEDKLKFNDFKNRYSVLNGIVFAAEIFTMQYFKEYHVIWLPITIIILLIPDKGLTKKLLIDFLVHQ
ncbi:MAG: hypothetical protein ACRCTZ_02615 [Sarcina sp.]